MQDSKEKQCLIFVRNNANDTADRIEAYAKKSGMKVVETIFNTDKKAVERLRYYMESIHFRRNMESVLMQRAGAMNLLSFLMNDMTEENRKLKLIIFPGETVVIDEYGKRIVACPTEDEAEEYIREQEE